MAGVGSLKTPCFCDLLEGLILVLCLVVGFYVGTLMGRFVVDWAFTPPKAPRTTCPQAQTPLRGAALPSAAPLPCFPAPPARPLRLMHTRQTATPGAVYSVPPLSDHLPAEALGNAEPRWRTSCQRSSPRRRTHAPFE